MDPFSVAQPSGMQGGILQQLAYNQAVNQARTRGIVSGTPMFVGDMDAFSAMEYYQYTKQQEKIMQLAAADEATQMANTMAGMTHLAGRQVSPQMMRGYQNLASGVSSLAVPFMIQSQTGRGLLDIASGGVSTANVSLAMSNIGQQMLDPLTGRRGLSAGLSSHIAIGMSDIMRNDRRDLYGNRMGGGSASHGFTGQEIGEFLAIQQRRGHLPSTGALSELMSSPTIHRMLDRGDITPSQLALTGVNASNAERFLSEINPIAMDRAVADSTGSAMNYLRSKGLVSAQDFNDRIEGERLLIDGADQMRNDFASRAQAESEANLRQIENRLSGLAPEPEDGLFKRAAKGVAYYGALAAGGYAGQRLGGLAGGAVGGLFGTATVPGLGTVSGAGVGTGIGMLGGGYYGGVYAQEYAGKLLYGDQVPGISGKALSTEDKAEFDRALLELTAKGARGFAGIDRGEADDYQKALAALRSGDIATYQQTAVSLKDPLKALEDAGTLMGRTPQQVYDMLNSFVDADGKFNVDALHRVASAGDNSDPFGSMYMEDVAGFQSSGRPTGSVIAEEYKNRISRVADQQLGALRAVKELLSDQGIDATLQESIQVLDDITNNSVNQLGYVKAEDITRKMHTASRRLGMTNDDLMQVNQLSRSIGQEFGLATGLTYTIGQEYMTNISSYADQGTDSLGIFGMSTQHQMAQSDMRVKAAALKSTEGQQFAAMRRLLQLNTVKIDESTPEGQRMARLFRESYTHLSKDSSNYLNTMLRDKDFVQTFSSLTGVSREAIMSAQQDEIANAAELSKGNTDNVISRAAAQNYVDVTLANRLANSYSGGALSIGGITDNAMRVKVARAMAGSITDAVGSDEAGVRRLIQESRTTTDNNTQKLKNAELAALFAEQLRQQQANPATRTEGGDFLLTMFQTDRARFDDMYTRMVDASGTEIVEAATRFSDASLNERDYQTQVNSMRGRIGSLVSQFDASSLTAIRTALESGQDVNPMDLLGQITKTDVTGRSAKTVESIAGVMRAHLDTTKAGVARGDYSVEYAEMERKASSELLAELKERVFGDPEKAKKLRDSAQSVEGKTQDQANAEFSQFNEVAKQANGDLEVVVKTLNFPNATFNFKDAEVTGATGTVEPLR